MPSAVSIQTRSKQRVWRTTGHPPFGHTAEELLNALERSTGGGFEGNAQSFRIGTKLAFKSTKHAGLDLTSATLAAILKYPWLKGQNRKKPHKWGAYKSEVADFEFARKICPPQKFALSPEAALMDWADDVTYSVHDLEDFLVGSRCTFLPGQPKASSGSDSLTTFIAVIQATRVFRKEQ
jgi:dGTPase